MPEPYLGRGSVRPGYHFHSQWVSHRPPISPVPIHRQFFHPSRTYFECDINAPFFLFFSPVAKTKPRGLHAARKLRTERRLNRWADEAYKKRALGTAYKVQPFGGASHAKGIVLEKL